MDTQIDQKSLSPIHFHSHNPEEKDAYLVAYQQFLKYEQPKLAEMLYKAINGDSRDLLIWYSLHSFGKNR